MNFEPGTSDWYRPRTASQKRSGLLGGLSWNPHRSTSTWWRRLVEDGKPDEAERLLVEFWNADQRWQERPIHRLVGLYGADGDEPVAIRDARQRLFRKALEYHRQGEYAAAIPITLAQMDGIFKDFTGKSSQQFFDPGNPDLVDNETLAGHSQGLPVVAGVHQM